MIVILKKKNNKFQSSVLWNSTKTTTTGAEESGEIFAHLTNMYMHEPEVRKNFRSVRR